MYCQKCGNEIDDSATYCSSCGTSQNQSQQNNNYGQSNQQNNGYGQPSYGPNNSYNGSHPQEKNTGLALILSFFIIGAGHLYVGKVTDGIVLFIAAVVMAVLGWLFLFPYIISIIIWIWALYDTNKKANEYNNALRQTGNPPW